MVFTVLFTVGCRRIDFAGDTGDLVLHLSVGDVETKASMQEGEQFKNLLVVTVDADNVTQRQYVELGSSSDYTSVVIEGLNPGECQVYAFANIDHKAWLAANNDIEKIKSGTAVDADKLLKILTGTSVPDPVPDSGAMLLTGQQRVTVTSGEKNIGEVKLYRPVARFKVSIHNNTKNSVTLNSLSFSNFNADRTYLLPHLDGSGAPVIPSDTDHRSLPSFAGSTTVGAGKTETVYTTLLYENKATDEYRMMASVSLGDQELNFGPSGALLRYIDPETSQVSPVTYIRRNQEMTVVLNIYQGVINADFNIQVISTTWAGDGKESTHTFE